MRFLDLDLEEGKDTLVVCDGSSCTEPFFQMADSSSNSLQKLMTIRQDTLFSRGKALTVLMQTDRRGSGRGFKAVASAVQRGKCSLFLTELLSKDPANLLFRHRLLLLPQPEQLCDRFWPLYRPDRDPQLRRSGKVLPLHRVHLEHHSSGRTQSQTRVYVADLDQGRPGLCHHPRGPRGHSTDIPGGVGSKSVHIGREQPYGENYTCVVYRGGVCLAYQTLKKPQSNCR